MKKIILGILLALTTFSSAHAGIERIQYRHSESHDFYRFYFTDEDGVRTEYDSTRGAGQSFADAVEEVVTNYGVEYVDTDNGVTYKGQAAVNHLVEELTWANAAVRNSANAVRDAKINARATGYTALTVNEINTELRTSINVL